MTFYFICAICLIYTYGTFMDLLQTSLGLLNYKIREYMTFNY